MMRARRQFGPRAARVGREVPDRPGQASPDLPRRTRASMPLHAAGFTLIELMIVIGLILLLVGGLGFSLGDTAGHSLATAQNLVAGLVDTARAEAAVNQTEARLVIYGSRPPTGDSGKFLRVLQVFRNEPSGSAAWVGVGNPVYLPRGVYVVPPSTAGLLAAGVAWPANPAPLSTLTANFTLNAAAAPPGTAFNGAALFWIGYHADGSLSATLGAQPYGKLAVATATLTNSLPAFTNSGAVRGVLIRPNGAVLRVNDVASF
jgi:prepilin-type N-terminal cleavage/methylation domain-containing protein